MKYYIRIDQKLSEQPLIAADFEAHLKYLKGIAKECRFLGGGFENESGGMVVFQATDIQAAREICDKDPIIQSGAYTYTLKAWDVIINSFE